MIEKGAILCGWRVREVDALGRRAACECVRCATRRLIAVAALEDRSVHDCGCAPATEPKRVRFAAAPTFAHQVAKAEGGGWRGSR